jgi:2-dehydropantoate 2-reductase
LSKKEQQQQKMLTNNNNNNQPPLHIAILGVGAIGTTFAYQLTKAKHQVTCIARGERYKQLVQQDNNNNNTITRVEGKNNKKQSSVTVYAIHEKLDESIEYDMLLVTVMEHQVKTILPTLTRSKAKKIQFMFNTVDKVYDELCEAVGKERFVFGFPILTAALLDDGKYVHFDIVTSGPLCSVSTDKDWAKTCTKAGIKMKYQPNMKAWLSTHVATIVTIMCLLWISHKKDSGATWKECRLGAQSLKEGFYLVQKMGYPVAPSQLKGLKYMPNFLVASLFWIATRQRSLRSTAPAKLDEPRNLIKILTEIATTKYNIKLEKMNTLDELL